MALTFEDVVEAARAKAPGLPMPDSDSWREGLELLLLDHAEQDSLSERGWGIMKAKYSDALAMRMKVDDYIRHHPEVLDQPIVRPVFILGMPRTGTTLVSYLMAADPANRSLLKWEAYAGVPPAAPGELKTDPRCLAEVAKDEAIITGNPVGAAQHFEAGDGPTECVHLIGQDFRSLMWGVLSDTPRYHDWILSCDMTPAYQHRKRMLQVLQSTNGGRWVLKMPSDSLFIRTLFETFPDAKVIWTHRDPYSTFASSISMRGTSRKIFSKDAGLGYMQKYFPGQFAEHLNRPLAMSQERGADIYDQYYDDLVSDPVGAIRKIYAWLGDPWTPEAEAGMHAWLADNPQGRFGKHAYSLEEWGFSRSEIEPWFADYLAARPAARAAEDA